MIINTLRRWWVNIFGEKETLPSYSLELESSIQDVKELSIAFNTFRELYNDIS